MSRAQLLPVGAGVATALLHLSVMHGPALGLVTAYFSMVPVAATGFGLGAMPATVAAAVAAVIVALTAPGVGALSLFLLTSAAPVLALVYCALGSRPAGDGTLQWYPLDRLLGILTGFCLVMFAAALVVFAGSTDGLQGAIRAFLDPVARSFGGDGAQLEGIVRFFPGLAGASWTLMIATNCAVAYIAVRRWGTPLRPDTRFRDIDAPAWPLLALALGASLSLFDGSPAFVGANVMVISGLPFFLVGLAVLHSVTLGWPGRPFVLGIFYLLTIFTMWPILPVCLLGIGERWLRLRRRAATTGTNVERKDRWK